MKPVAFFISCFFCFLILGISYFLLIDKCVILDREIPFTYRQFLLESSGSIAGKVIIDSGSNAIHAYDTEILSDYFRAPVIIAADNAGYPLRYKILNVGQFLRPGDALILPLEWNRYSARSELTDVFISHLIKTNQPQEHYFNTLPLGEKIRFVFTRLPGLAVLDSELFRTGIRDTEKSTRLRLSEFERRLKADNNRSYGGEIRNAPEKIHFAAALKTCHDYLFKQNKAAYGFGEVSAEFLATLELLQSLADAGVSIYFTWPNVVDSKSSKCYSDPAFSAQLEQHSQALVNLIESKGFEFIGKYSDHHFGPECFLNTYYHLRYDCARTNTHLLVTAFKMASVLPLEASISQDDLTDIVKDYLDKARKSLYEQHLEQLPVLAETTLTPAEQENSIFFDKGWSGTEETGTWSIGTESVFHIRLGQNLLEKQTVSLTIDGYYFYEDEKTGIEISGIAYGKDVLHHHTVVIDRESIKDQYLSVRLQHTNVLSPKMLGTGEDTRMIKFKLKTLSLH